MNKIFTYPFMDRLVILERPFEGNGRGLASLEVRLAERTKAWFKAEHFYRCKSASQKIEVLKACEPHLQSCTLRLCELDVVVR